MAEFGDDSGDGGGGEKTAYEALHGGSEKGYAARAWDKCKKLAKNMVIAGVAISSAPIVVPPILLASTVSIAFAIPFGVLLAGYAWTEKVMASLIPSPGTQLQEESSLSFNSGDEEELLKGDAITAVAGGDIETSMPVLRLSRDAVALPEEEKLLKETFPPEAYSVLDVSTVDLDVFVEESRPSLEPVSSSTVDNSPYQAEDMQREKTIRKEIDDIRRIIGSKGDPEPYCAEELKALYLFLGIEPPVFSEVSSPIESVEGQLQVLKSIIGVK